MKEERTNEERLARYLLGQLPEQEQQKIEQHAFDDDEFYRQLLEVEDDLRCAYAQGTLSLAQKELFEQRFLIFADERKKLALARDMIAELRQSPVADAWTKASNRGERKTDRSLLSWIPGWSSPVTRYAVAAAALVVVAGGAWLLFETAKLRNEINRLHAERATAEQQLNQRSAEERARIEQLEQLDKQLGEERDLRAQLEEELAKRGEQADERSMQPAVIALFLSPGGIRGGGQTKRLVLAPGVEQVRLRLELPGDASKSYRAVLLNADGKEVSSRADLRARREGSRRIASLTLSARLLAEDDYELKLTGVDADGQAERAASYYFTILKK
ncbi:MAG: hypothetical protein ND895_07680 [Pyrinomonadaceae bacterium]|nr:hypothetical protein [Pyrinomonadaceae bacterium]